MKFIRCCVVALSMISMNAFADDVVTCQKLSPTSQKITATEPGYTIEIDYPAFTNTSQCQTDHLTKNIADFVAKSKQEFLAGLPTKTKPNNVTSTLDIDYSIYVNQSGLLSIRFRETEYYVGSAHPMTQFYAITYDTTKDKQLALGDLFTDKKYLDFIADQASEMLKARFSKTKLIDPDVRDKWISEGTSAEEKNYQVWNVIASGLLFTFPPYQVAAYAVGSPEVTLTNEQLANVGFILPGKA